LQKTMVVVEGVARTLNPTFNMWKTSEPVVSDWIKANLGPPGMLSDARDGVNALISLVRQAPDLAARTERLSREIDAMAEHGLRFDAETAHAIGRAEARYTRSGRIALWLIALALVWIAWHLT
jgi:ubiquinone biosynthesis protein